MLSIQSMIQCSKISDFQGSWWNDLHCYRDTRWYESVSGSSGSNTVNNTHGRGHCCKDSRGKYHSRANQPQSATDSCCTYTAPGFIWCSWGTFNNGTWGGQGISSPAPDILLDPLIPRWRYGTRTEPMDAQYGHLWVGKGKGQLWGGISPRFFRIYLEPGCFMD